MANNIFYKYNLKLRWPAVCRNRSTQTLQERPDLVEKMTFFRNKVFSVCKLILKSNWRIDETQSMTGVRIWFETGQDAYDFIIRQPEFNWEIVPEINVINILTRQIQTFGIEYTPTGVVIN